jgi:hypothetical protein
MVNQNRIPRALSTLILLGYLAMGLGGQSAAVAADGRVPGRGVGAVGK